MPPKTASVGPPQSARGAPARRGRGAAAARSTAARSTAARSTAARSTAAQRNEKARTLPQRQPDAARGQSNAAREQPHAARGAAAGRGRPGRGRGGSRPQPNAVSLFDFMKVADQDEVFKNTALASRWQHRRQTRNPAQRSKPSWVIRKDKQTHAKEIFDATIVPSMTDEQRNQYTNAKPAQQRHFIQCIQDRMLGQKLLGNESWKNAWAEMKKNRDGLVKQERDPFKRIVNNIWEKCSTQEKTSYIDQGFDWKTKRDELERFIRFWRSYFLRKDTKESIQKAGRDFKNKYLAKTKELSTVKLELKNQLDLAMQALMQEFHASSPQSADPKPQTPDDSLKYFSKFQEEAKHSFLCMNVKGNEVKISLLFQQINKFSIMCILRSFLKPLYDDENMHAMLKEFKFDKTDLESVRNAYQENPTKTFRLPQSVKATKDKQTGRYKLEDIRRERAFVDAVTHTKDRQDKNTHGFQREDLDHEVWLGTSFRDKHVENPYMI